MIGGNRIHGTGDPDAPARSDSPGLGCESETIAAGLHRRLELVTAAHGLTRAMLRSTHRDIGRLEEIRALPSIEEFCRRTSQPRAERYRQAAMHEIGIGRQRLDRAIDRHIRRRSDEAAARAAVDELVVSLPDGGWLAETARWWERRIHLAAVADAMPALLLDPVEDIPDRLAAVELELSVRPPWSFEDQLLRSFEAAHRQLTVDGERVLRAALDRFGADRRDQSDLPARIGIRVPERADRPRMARARPAPLDLTVKGR